MWCSHCQQDVPRVASTDDEGKMCCARCGESLASVADSALESDATDDTAQSNDSDAEVKNDKNASTEPPVDFDDWEFEEDLQAVERLLRSLRSAGLLEPPFEKDRAVATHAAHQAVPHWHVQSTAKTSTPVAKSSTSKPKRRYALTSFMAWTLLSFGLMTFVCGAVLVGWSFVENRSELWDIGLPLALGGQAVLLIGLLFQLEGIWQSSQDTSSTLDELDEQLHDLRHQTTLLTASKDSTSKSFYSHMAQGASPDMLLADLKGQLDMLAVKIANERK